MAGGCSIANRVHDGGRVRFGLATLDASGSRSRATLSVSSAPFAHRARLTFGHDVATSELVRSWRVPAVFRAASRP